MHSPRKILALHSGDNWLRGSEGVLLSVLGRLDRQRFSARVLCNQPVMAGAVRALGVAAELHDLTPLFVYPGEVSLSLFRWFRAWRALRRTIREYEPDVVYCNSGSASQLGILAARAERIPVVVHLHGPYLRRYVLGYRIHRASAVICVSQAVADQVSAKVRFRVPPSVIHNGIDLSRFHPPPTRDGSWRERLAIPGRAVVFGQVSSLIPRKGLDLLLRAHARLNSDAVYLVIVGDGPNREEYVRLARKLGVDGRVRFIGNADPAPYYQHVFDVSVLPSRNEAFGLSIVEAAACGVPSIGTAVHGIPEVIEHEASGLLVPPDDEAALSCAMQRLATGGELRRRMGGKAFDRARMYFSVEAQVEKIEDLLAGLIARRGAAPAGARRRENTPCQE